MKVGKMRIKSLDFFSTSEGWGGICDRVCNYFLSMTKLITLLVCHEYGPVTGTNCVPNNVNGIENSVMYGYEVAVQRILNTYISKIEIMLSSRWILH